MNASTNDPSSRMGSAARSDEVAAGLAEVRRRIDAACTLADRSSSEVTLIVVTKTYPASDVRLLADLGVRDVGENRDQEAAPKRAEVEGVFDSRSASVRWHCIGQVQTNKARSIAHWADAVHSLDRPRLVSALGRAATDQGRDLEALIQISLDTEPGRGGCSPQDALALADLVADTPGLLLRGVMAVAPLGVDPRAPFERLAQVADEVRRQHPAASWISAGMSGDLDEAVAAGATHVRVGSAVLGRRPEVG